MAQDKNEEHILWFEELRKTDIPLVGGKNANLGELTYAKLPVPPGFAITSTAYKYFITKTGIASKIYQTIADTVRDINDPKEYEEASKKIRKLIEATKMPKDLEIEIIDFYKQLNKKTKQTNMFVAVRSSATAEDLPDASFAGQQETFLNTRGTGELIKNTIKCWSSLFTPRAIFYRTEKGFKHESVLISVGVQKMINSKCAGVVFTMNPVTGDLTQIMIEGNWGLGESVVSGAVTPDHFEVDKSTQKILVRIIAKKPVEYIRDPKTGKTVHAKIPDNRQDVPCITDQEISKIAEYAQRIEQHYGKPQDIEWAIDRDLKFPESVFIVQSRPETVWSSKAVVAAPSVPEVKASLKPSEMKVVVKGLAAGKRSTGAGVAKVVFSPEDADKLMKKGDVLVTTMTNPDFVPYMRMANAIVTDKGGVTCHAAIVSRELGIPCIVGADNATKIMKTGKEYTVDAKSGVVYEGIIEAMAPTAATPTTAVSGQITMTSVPVTATKIYMNLGVPEKIEEYKNLPFEGIGLMRMEFILASYIGEHPVYMLENGRGQEFTDKLAEGIATVARAIQPRPVVVRFSDFKTNEYRGLKGGEKYEIVEENPMLGWRGCSRYISKWYIQAFRLECQAIQ